jgi:hypothetical protein
MKSRSLFKTIIATCLVLVAMPIFAAAQSTGDEVFQSDLRLSGLTGISRGQAASLNVTNSSREVKEVQFFFIDLNGRLLKSSSARIVPGQSMSLMLSHSELRDPAGRLQIRGAVRLADPPSPDVDPPQPDLVISNLEIIDEATGRTSFGLLLPAVRGANVYFPFIEAGAIRQEQ